MGPSPAGNGTNFLYSEIQSIRFKMSDDSPLPLKYLDLVPYHTGEDQYVSMLGYYPVEGEMISKDVVLPAGTTETIRIWLNWPEVDYIYLGGNICIDNIAIEPASSVPIPGAAWLLGSGVIGLIGLKRRR